jgi:hypothetical protein
MVAKLAASVRYEIGDWAFLMKSLWESKLASACSKRAECKDENTEGGCWRCDSECVPAHARERKYEFMHRIEVSEIILQLFADLEQFHVKNQCCIRRNYATRSARSITQPWGNSQLPLASDLHSRDSFIPAFDHLSGSQRK